jgi:uncharacterized protein YndB with AHSA1/START domain
MTLRDTTAPSQYEAVTLEFDLKHAPAKVWRALTEPALISEWLLPVKDFSLQRGASFKFTAPPQPSWDGVVNCRVVEIDAPRKLSYNWVVGDIDTIVTFTLTPTASGTHLTLVQAGFKPAQKKNFGGARYGLKMMGTNLIDLLERIS